MSKPPTEARRRRVKAWLVYDHQQGDVWREHPSLLPMMWKRHTAMTKRYTQIPCELTYELPPKRKARR